MTWGPQAPRKEKEIMEKMLHERHTTVNCAFDGDMYNFNPEALTRREPDSLEKLRDDIKRQAERYEHSGFTQVWEWHDRLAALIERGARMARDAR